MKRSRTDAEETSSRHISSTFKLQCEEFQKDRIAGKAIVDKCEKLAKDIEESLKSAKLKHKCNFNQISYWEKYGIQFPLAHINSIIMRTTSTDPEYVFSPPTNLSSLKIRRSADKSVTKVVYVEIPEQIFGKRDFVNVIYPVKRAHFMCSCITAIKDSLKIDDVSFVAGSGTDLIFPNVLVKKEQEGVKVLLHFYATSNALAKPSRFAPTQGNIRPTTVCETYHKKNEVATPKYNQRILRTMLTPIFEKEVASQIKKEATLNNALLLLTSWFECRNICAFDEVFLSAVMVYLLKKNIINDKQETLVIFKNVLNEISEWDLSSAYTLEEEQNEQKSIEYLAAFDVVLLETSGFWNVAADITFDDLNKAKSLIKKSIPVLGDFHAFDSLFNDVQSFSSGFDHFYKLYLPSTVFDTIITKFVEDVVDWNDRLKSFGRALQKIIHTAMGERFEYLSISTENFLNMWNFKVKGSTMPVDNYLLLGFKIKKQWQNPLTVGPVANDPGAKEFRQFWGDECQLRKFADTRICECMVWGEKPSDSVTLLVLKFLLNKKYGLPENLLSWRSKLPSEILSDRPSYEKLNCAFASLSSLLRNLKGIPLMITNIHGTSPYLRYSEPNAADIFSDQYGPLIEDHRLPSVARIPKYVPSVEVLIKLQYSGKWGNDFEGIRKLTAAFYIQIADQLKNHNLFAVATMDHLFVVKDDIVFKLIIVHDKVRKMLEAKKNELIASGVGRVETSIEGKRLREYTKRFVSEALLAASIQSFGTKYSVFADTVQLTKRWFGANLLSGCINDYALEMIVCAAVEQISMEAPLSPFCAFRRVLYLLANYPWAARPLIIDFDEKWTDDEIANMEASFLKMRPVLPPMVIITNEDTVGSKWTIDGPTPVFLKRVTFLAQSSLKVLENNLVTVNSIDLKNSLFSSNFSSYDAVINIHERMISRVIDHGDTDNRKGLPVVDFDPVEGLVSALNANFDSVALFFYNKYCGTQIAVKFKPQEEKVQAKISRCNLHKYVGDHLELNKEEILEGIKIIGKGIVKDIVQN